MTSLNPNEFKINRALQSAVGFDDIIFHIDFNTSLIPKIESSKINPPFTEFYIKEHLGIGQAYNAMIKHIESEWICCFCDDDFFDEKELAKLLVAIRAGDFADADIIHFKCHVSGNRPYHPWGAAKIKQEWLEEGNIIPAASFFRKSAWVKVGGFRGEIYHDWILWLRALKAGCRFKYFDGCVYWFMMRPDSAAVRQTSGMTSEEARENVIKYANE